MLGTLSRVSITLLFVASIVLSGCEREAAPEGDMVEPEGSPDKVSVRFPIPIVENGQTTFYVAEDQGFYADENLEVRFEMGSPELNPVKMVASGQDDFGILGGPDTLLVARSRGQRLKAIAVVHANSNFPCLLTLADSGITQLEQLQDSKIGFFYGHISTDVLRNLLRKNQIRYEEIDVGFDYSQLITGKIDAQWAFTVTAGLDLPARGVAINFIRPEDYGIVTHGYTIFATEETIQERRDMVLRFLRASLLGVRETVGNPSDANRSLLQRNPELDAELSLKRQQAYNAVTSNGNEFPPGYMSRQMFQTTYDRLVEEAVIKDEFDVSEAFTTEFLEEIYQRPFQD